MDNFDNALSAALLRVGRLKGVIALDEDEIGIAGGLDIAHCPFCGEKFA